MQKKWLYLAVAGVITLVVIGFFYREARNEIYFLCQNFTEGMPKVIVEEQLSTANLSRIREIHKRELIMDSVFNLYIHHCSIEFSLDRKVTKAEYGSL